MTKQPRPWTVGAAYVGAVVGAGFGSGREILQFFAAYGRWGLAGAATAGVAFAWLGARVLDLAIRRGLRDHRQLFRLVLGPRWARPMDLATTVFLFLGVGIVLAGAGALAAEQWGLPHALGAVGMAAVLAVVLLAGRRGLLWGNAVLVPLLVAFSVSVLVREAAAPGWLKQLAAARRDPHLAVGAWYVGAFLYVGYNLLVAAVTLCAAAPALRGDRAERRWGVLGGLCIGALALFSSAALSARYGDVAGLQLPLGKLAAAYGPAWVGGYALTLAACLFTTGLATCYALAARLAPRGRQGRVAVLGLAASLPLGTANFADLVRVVYPLMGLAGVVFLVGLAIYRPPGDRTALR